MTDLTGPDRRSGLTRDRLARHAPTATAFSALAQHVESNAMALVRRRNPAIKRDQQ